MAWWSQFHPSWYGVTFVPPTRSTPHIIRTSDASGNCGCGAYPSFDWFQFQWPEYQLAGEITVKEMLDIVLALAFWGTK